MFKRALLFLVLTCLGVNAPAQTFSPAVDYPAGASPQAIVQGDFNGDGTVDLVVANTQSDSLSFFAGRGDGAFAPVTTIALHGSPNSLAAADFNGDGKLDIAVSYGAATGSVVDLEILYGKGDGTFATPVPLHESSSATTQASISKIVAADVNGDNRLDLVVALNGLTVFLNQGGGVFKEAGPILSGMNVDDFVLADLNKDGNVDIAVLTSSTGTAGVTGQVFVAAGKGDGTFASPVPLPFTTSIPGGIAAGDVNQDGRTDLVLCDYGQVSQASQQNGSIQVLLQQPDGSFVASETLTAVPNPWRALLGAFTGSGHLDLATLATATSSSSAVTSNALIIYPGNGDGTFQTPNQFALTSSPWDLIAAPFSTSKMLDVATTNPSAGTISVLVNENSSQQNSSSAVAASAVAAVSAASTIQASSAVETPFTITSSMNPSIYGQVVTFTATGTFTCPNCTNTPGPPSGNVTFYDGGTVLGTINLSGNFASLTISSLTAGSHTITVQFVSANSAFGSGSGGPLTQTVNQSSTTTSISSSVNPAFFGQDLTFTIGVAAVAPGGGMPSGSVSILDGGTNIGTAVLSGGQASFPISILPVGQNNIAAAYQGDPDFKSSASFAVTQVVNKASTTTNVASSANPSVYGQPVIFTDTEDVVAPGAGVPTGGVTFEDGTTDIDTTTLNTGHASFTILTLSVGGHSIAAAYAGDSDFNGSSSSAVVQIVNKSQTSITTTSSANPSVYGQTVTVSVTVSAVAPGAGTPTGTVTLLDGSTNLGSFNLTSAQASATLSTPAVGTHEISVTYSGDNNFQSSLASLTQTVDKASGTITVNSSANPSVYGQPVTSTITVGAVAPGAGTPTGLVVVSDHGVNLGTMTLSNGKGTLTVSALAAGTHALALSYSGDNNFNPATDALAQIINKAATVVSVSSSLNPAIIGQSITLSAGITVSSPGSGTPTGTITFLDTGSVIGSATAISGQASLTISTLSGGNHAITASYSGDDNFQPGESAAIDQTINVSDFAVAIAKSEGTVAPGQTFKTGMQLTPTYGFTGPVTLNCAAEIPQGSCSISPASGKLDGRSPLAAVVTVQTAGSVVGTADAKPLGMHGLQMFAAAIFGLPAFLLSRRKHGFALLLGLALFGIGCGGSSSRSHPTPPKRTPPGAYTIAVQAQSGSLIHSGTITLTVD